MILKNHTQGPFQLTAKRVRYDDLDRMLDIFDAHTAGRPLTEIARTRAITVEEAKGMWRRARMLIEHWLDIASHLESCAECQACLQGHRERYCPALELQIGVGRSASSRLHPLPDRALELLSARQRGDLPARGRSRRA